VWEGYFITQTKVYSRSLEGVAYRRNSQQPGPYCGNALDWYKGEGWPAGNDEYSFVLPHTNGITPNEVLRHINQNVPLCLSGNPPGADTLEAALSPANTWTNYARVRSQPEYRGLQFGTIRGYSHFLPVSSCPDPNLEEVDYRLDDYDLGGGNGLTFRAPVYYGTNTPVIFTFEGVDYARTNALDLTQVKFKDPSGTTYLDPVETNNVNGFVGYLITVNGGQEYSLSQSSFQWPGGFTQAGTVQGITWICSSGGEEQYTVSAHWLTFSGFHNEQIIVNVEIQNQPPYQDTDDLQVQYFKKVGNSFTYDANPLQVYYGLTEAHSIPPDSVLMRIRSPGGTVIRTSALSTVLGDQQLTSWDGKDNAGKFVEYGAGYQLEIVAAAGSTIRSATHMFDVYEIRQGNIVYRNNAGPTPDEHGAIVYEYNGGNKLADVQDDAKYNVIHHRGVGDFITVNTLANFKENTNEYLGEYCPPNLTGSTRGLKRQRILEKATIMLNTTPQIPYVGGTHTDVLHWKLNTWDGTIGDIRELRSDGFCEVAYEAAGVRLYGDDDWWNIMTPHPSQSVDKHNGGWINSLTPSRQRSSDISTNRPDSLHCP
jgi:hypothetical protein